MGNYLRKLPLWGDDKLRMKGGINFEYPTVKEFEQMLARLSLIRLSLREIRKGNKFLDAA